MKSVVKTYIIIIYIYQLLTAARPGWVTSNEVSGSSLLCQFPAALSVSPFTRMQDQPHFVAEHNVVKDNAKNMDFLLLLILMMIVTSTSSEPVDNRLPTQVKKVNKPARNLQVPVKVQNLTRHW